MKNEDSVLTMYLKEINKIPLLSHEEETELALKAQKGDVAAKNKIINKIFTHILNSYSVVCNSTNDLPQ